MLKGDPVGSARLAAADERTNRALADAVERHATKDPGVRGILKWASVVCHPESESQKKIAMDTEQDPTPHPLVSHGGSSASGTRPSITTSADLNTDMTREVRVGPAPDKTRASGEGYAGGDVVMREDEDSGGHSSSEGSDSRRRITTKREPREVRDERSSTTEQHVPRRMLGKTTPREQAVAVTTQEAQDGSCEKTMRIVHVENSTLNWVSISSAGALDMAHCDFSVKSARDEIRHIMGSSEPDVIIGCDRDQNRGAERRTRITWNFCSSCTRHRLRAVGTSCTS